MINVWVGYYQSQHFYYNKKPPSPRFNTKTILGGGVHMNDLNKILGIYDAKVNVNCVKDILG